MRVESFAMEDFHTKVKPLSHVRLFATPRTVAYQVPLSMGFSRQEYWSEISQSQKNKYCVKLYDSTYVKYSEESNS